VVTNYHLPTEEVAVLVEVGVDYASDLAHVERVTCEAARAVQRTVAGAVPEFVPFIRYHTFGESSIDLTLILRARQITDQYLLKHEVVKSLARAYAAEGIVIPFPIRALDLDQQRRRP
jgi:small-conductance mechanosensitive channel